MIKACATLSFFLSVALCGLAPAHADDACASFKWLLTREQGWFQAEHPTMSSGGTLLKAEGAVTLTLSPVEGVAFPASPDHKPAAGSFGATISIATIEQGGIYQVTLSDEGWIDVVQAGASIKSSEFSGKKGCAGIRKSVRFDLKAGTAILQISGVKANQINVAIGPAS
jgi:hypothetical protein